MSTYFLQKSPFVVPTSDGKTIEEHFGHASIQSALSIARMVAPPGWSEPYQTPDFEEYTLIVSGKKMIKVNGQEIVLEAGQSIKILPNVRVQYSNPFDTPCEYVSVCLPAFSFEKVNREEEN